MGYVQKILCSAQFHIIMGNFGKNAYIDTLHIGQYQLIVRIGTLDTVGDPSKYICFPKRIETGIIGTICWITALYKHIFTKTCPCKIAIGGYCWKPVKLCLFQYGT